MFEAKKSVFSILDGKTVIPASGAILYLSGDKVGLQLLQDNQHKLIVVELPHRHFKMIDDPRIDEDRIKVRELTRDEYVIKPEDTLASMPISVINAKNAFSPDWNHFSKLYLQEEISNVLTFVNSLNGVTSLDKFDDFIKEKATEHNLLEVVQAIDSKANPPAQRGVFK